MEWPAQNPTKRCSSHPLFRCCQRLISLERRLMAAAGAHACAIVPAPGGHRLTVRLAACGWAAWSAAGAEGSTASPALRGRHPPSPAALALLAASALPRNEHGPNATAGCPKRGGTSLAARFSTRVHVCAPPQVIGSSCHGLDRSPSGEFRPRPSCACASHLRARARPGDHRISS